jgi:flagellar hook-basal body complex protein FliE
MNIQGIHPGIVPPVPAALPSATAGSTGFSSVLKGALESVESTRDASQQTIERFLSGEGGELHETILAAQRAELSFEMLLQVKNKVVQAYQEVMRMQL